MIPIKIIINGVETEKNIPVSFDEVSWAQFLQVAACGNDLVKMYSVFTGIDPKTFCKATVRNFDTVLAILNFLNEVPQSFVPKTILGYKLPEDLAFEMPQQYIDVKSILLCSGLNGLKLIEKYPFFCAVYTCKEKYGEYSLPLAKKLAGEFLQAPMPEVLAIGNATLKKMTAIIKRRKPVETILKSLHQN